jgi:hypothetical protein
MVGHSLSENTVTPLFGAQCWRKDGAVLLSLISPSLYVCRDSLVRPTGGKGNRDVILLSAQPSPFGIVVGRDSVAFLGDTLPR